MKVSVKYRYQNQTVHHRFDNIPIPELGKYNYSTNEIQSQLFYKIDIGTENINMAKAIVGTLLKSPIDSPEGITLTADRPYQKKACINITRPAVLRTYYGTTTRAISATKLERITYGSTDLSGSLSMDPRSFCTKPMSTEMHEFGKSLKAYATNKLKMQHKSTDILKYAEFNHCTILIYNPHISNINSKLPYHCDCIYDTNGHFNYNKNTQGINTPVLVYTLGNSRTLYFRKRKVIMGKGCKSSWKNDPLPSK